MILTFNLEVICLMLISKIDYHSSQGLFYAIRNMLSIYLTSMVKHYQPIEQNMNVLIKNLMKIHTREKGGYSEFIESY